MCRRCWTYPNHLARGVVLAFAAQDPVLWHMARAHWGLVPDLGTDLLLIPLLHVLPVHAAGRMVVTLALLLPVAGAIAYSRAALGGGRGLSWASGWWPTGRVFCSAS